MAEVSTNKELLFGSATAEDKRLDRLLDYTKFPVGIYLSAGGGLLALIGSVLPKDKGLDFLKEFIGSPPALLLSPGFMLIAGFAGGVIASCCTQYRTFEELWCRRQDPHKLRLLTGQTWAFIEHGSFWISVVLAYAVLSGKSLRRLSRRASS